MGCGPSSGGALFEDFDLDKPEVGDAEKALHDECVELIDQTSSILGQLGEYEGCAEFIKLAVRTPSAENDVAAWNSVVPAVNMLKNFYDYYSEFKEGLFKVLAFVCRQDPTESLPAHPALTRLIVRMFDFVIRFDALKMSKASIQNDFSFYRRSMNRMKRGNVDLNVSEPPVNDEIANRMSLFFAYPNPFTKALIDEFARVASDIPQEYLQRTFAVTCKACRSMIVVKESDDMIWYRAIVAAMMFYDYSSAQGVFVNRSEIEAMACIGVLKSLDAPDLINTLRYGSRTYNSDSTPAKLKALMDS